MSLRNATYDEAAVRVLQHCLQGTMHDEDEHIITIANADATGYIKSLGRPPREAMALEEVLKDANTVFEHRAKLDHPRFFGMIPSPVSKHSWIGDMLNSALNSNATCWYLGSGVSAIENSLISWASEQVGLPSSAGGVFVSGGSVANMTGLATARDAILTFEERCRAVVYCSEQTHCSNAKALRIIGFGDHQLCKIPTDSSHRIKPEMLEAAVRRHRQQGRIPFCVIATCGTTNTGSIDPLHRLSIITKAEGMWLHVDGAYGASAALSKSHRSVVSELAHCDSLSWDFHKWGFQTYGCAVVLVADKKYLRQCFATGGDYLQDAGQDADNYPNAWNYGPEMSKPARGMKLWFTLRMLGLDKIGEMIDHGFTLSNTVETTLRQLPKWEIFSPSQLGIVCFRYAPPGRNSSQLDMLNKQISKAAIDMNLCAPLTTQLRGCTVMRICSIHPDLSVSEMLDILHSLDAIAQQLAEDFQADTASVPYVANNLQKPLGTAIPPYPGSKPKKENNPPNIEVLQPVVSREVAPV